MKQAKSKRIEKLRNIISMLLIIIFVFVFVTGLVMIPFLQGIFGTKDIISGSRTSPIEQIHMISGLVMGLLSIIHIILELKHKMQLKNSYTQQN